MMWKKEVGAYTLEIALAGVQSRYTDQWNERNTAFALNQANIFGRRRPNGGRAGVLTISPTYQKVLGYYLISVMAFIFFFYKTDKICILGWIYAVFLNIKIN